VRELIKKKLEVLRAESARLEKLYKATEEQLNMHDAAIQVLEVLLKEDEQVETMVANSGVNLGQPLAPLFNKQGG
jgi:NADP-dependent 3-hydroxy acid dehydrogenase YdfG